jgi:Zn-finger protein
MPRNPFDLTFDPIGGTSEKRKRNVSSRIRNDLMTKPKKCAYCRKTDAMHLHHIRGFAKGGSDRKGNLVQLCANCHYKIHHGQITDEQLKRRLGIKIKNKRSTKKKKTKRKSSGGNYWINPITGRKEKVQPLFKW